jgi:hypothetical protein
LNTNRPEKSNGGEFQSASRCSLPATFEDHSKNKSVNHQHQQRLDQCPYDPEIRTFISPRNLPPYCPYQLPDQITLLPHGSNLKLNPNHSTPLLFKLKKYGDDNQSTAKKPVNMNAE